MHLIDQFILNYAIINLIWIARRTYFEKNTYNNYNYNHNAYFIINTYYKNYTLDTRYIDIYDIGSETTNVGNRLNFDSNQTIDTTNITFTEFDSTSGFHLEIQNYNKIKISSSLAEGRIRVKLTQGDLWTTEIIKEKIPSNSNSILIPLDTWDKNELLTIWVIADKAKEGSVDIKLIE